MVTREERLFVIEKTGCSQTVVRKLDRYVLLLEEWQKKMNLVASSTLPVVWSRHVWDSAQLANFLKPTDKTILDLGSGAGFPALVLACLNEKTHFFLIESDKKKCAFLQAVTEANHLQNVTVINDRIENTASFQTDVITARALAPLDKLIKYALPFMAIHTRCLFMKGKKADEELAAAQKKFLFAVEKCPSLTSGEGRILILSKVRKNDRKHFI